MRRLAIIKGSAAFLAPLIGMVPFKRLPPTMRMRSMASLPRRKPPKAKPAEDRQFRFNPLSYLKSLKTFQVRAGGKNLACSLTLLGAEGANF